MTSIDLHIHSVYSDGLLPPEALCRLALKKHVHTLALCDHDTTDGLSPMMEAVAHQHANGNQLFLLPSVELSAGSEGRTHILGYGVKADIPAIREALENIRQMRAERLGRMTAALEKIGLSIPCEFLPSKESRTMPLGRPHVARALVRMGVTDTMEEAFEQYLREGKPAYFPLTYLSAADAVALLRQAGAVPVLAHPMRLGLTPPLLEALVESLQGAGLMGLEVFHPSASRRDIRPLENMARRRGLLVTGGSDFHGDRDSRSRLGELPSGWKTCQADFTALVDQIAQLGGAVPEQ